jgi:DNA-binding beta-propeller fold protein YncE
VACIAVAVVLVASLLRGSAPPQAQVIRVGDVPTALALGPGGMWVANQRAGTLTRLDAATGRPVGRPLEIGGAPARLVPVAVGLWVADASRGVILPVLLERRRVLRRIAMGADIADVVLADGTVWTASTAEGAVRWLPAGSRRPRVLGVGRGPVALAAEGRWVVAADAAAGTLARIDARERQLAGPAVPTGAAPVAVALRRGVAWVANSGAGTVTRVDVARGRAIGAPIRVGPRPVAIAADDRDVYVACAGDETVVPIDPRSGEVGEPVAIGREPAAVALTRDAVWVANSAEDTVSRIAR